MDGERRVAILTPARPVHEWLGIVLAPAEQWSIVLDPEAFPDPARADPPWPLHCGLMRFDTYGEAEAFVALSASERVAA